MKKKWKEKLDNIVCDKCGYQNHKDMIARYGRCRRCGKILDDNVVFQIEMCKKLHIKRRGEKSRYE